MNNCQLCGQKFIKNGAVHRYCSPRCQDMHYSYRHPNKALAHKLGQYVTESKLNVLMALNDNGGYPRLLGHDSTLRSMINGYLIIEVGNGYYVMTQFGIEMLDAYLGGN